MATRQPRITPKYGHSCLHTRVKQLKLFGFNPRSAIYMIWGRAAWKRSHLSMQHTQHSPAPNPPAHVSPIRREARLPDLHQHELPSGHMADRTGCGIYKLMASPCFTRMPELVRIKITFPPPSTVYNILTIAALAHDPRASPSDDHGPWSYSAYPCKVYPVYAVSASTPRQL